jgi:hypothetical protein
MLTKGRLQVARVRGRKMIFAGEQIVESEAACCIGDSNFNQVRLADGRNLDFRTGKRRVAAVIDDRTGKAENSRLLPHQCGTVKSERGKCCPAH